MNIYPFQAFDRLYSNKPGMNTKGPRGLNYYTPPPEPSKGTQRNWGRQFYSIAGTRTSQIETDVTPTANYI